MSKKFYVAKPAIKHSIYLVEAENKREAISKVKRNSSECSLLEKNSFMYKEDLPNIYWLAEEAE